MRRRPQKAIALLVSLPGALLTVAAIGWLIAIEVQATRRAPGDKERLAALQKLTDRDPGQIPALEDERERQTQARLKRETDIKWATYSLIVGAALFLVGAKWLLSLRGRRAPDLDKIAARRVLHSAGTSRSGLQPSSRPEPETLSADPAEAEVDLAPLDDAIRRCGWGRDATLPLLQAIQNHYRYVPQEALRHVCATTEITPARIAGVASFYTQFRRTPVGRHLVKVCHGTACHVSGAQHIADEIHRYLGIQPGRDTDARRQFTVQQVACLGCCTLAPVMQIDQTTYGHLAPDLVPGLLEEFLASSRRPDRGGNGHVVTARGSAPSQGEIRIGLGSCCLAGGSGKVYEALQRALAETGAGARIKRVGCVGMCHQTPLVEAVTPAGESSLYAGVGPADAKAIVLRHFRARRLGRRFSNAASGLIEGLISDRRQRLVTHHALEVRDPPVAAFLGPQKRIATEHCGRIDPTDLDEYLRLDGFRALQRCLKELTPQEVIAEIRRSGLRGRGGAGFPSGLKWARVRQAAGDHKYVICNGDEGDPGAFMDRMLMESFPYRIIEGMAIAAGAVGAQEGLLYIRAEYLLAVRRIREAIRLCERRSLLGDDILGTGRKLRLRVTEGAGAFVCGEETALIASLEGRRGMPNLRPPYPAERGLWGRPTLVQNVETYAMVPWIMRHHADHFAGLGTPTSKGTKVFALAGKIKRGGLIEVPMGVTIRHIVEQIGGGIKEDRPFKAVQIGGPSGGCVPAGLADTPVDYEALHAVGAIMGSGGLVVLDDSDCMVDLARYFLTFTQNQSCGQCTYCRIGTRRMLDILDRLCTGRGRRDDLGTLERLAHSVRQGSLCGLGRSAPNPVLTTLRYFRQEYQAHLAGRCPAAKCTDLITYRVTEACCGCTLCAQHCPVEAIAFTPYHKHEIDQKTCTRCGMCRSKCPENAIEVV